MDALTYLSGIAVMLILGILATILARKLKTSNILFLLIIGIIIGNTSLRNIEIFQFPADFLISLAILTLAIIVFDGSSGFHLRELDALSTKTFEVVIVFMLFNIILLTTVLNFFFYGFTAQGILFGIILAVIMAGTDPASVFILLGDRPHKVLQFLRIEALLNTPIMVLLPFLLLDLLTTTTPLFNTFIEFIGPFLQQVIVGVGTGVLIGAIVFKVMRTWYSESVSPVAVIAAALLSYVLSENLGGNGVLAVAVLGLLFGNTYVKQKGTLQDFSKITAYSLEILVFVLIGLFVTLPTDPLFWACSLAILLAAMLSRFLTLKLVMHEEHRLREIIFMTLNMPKGIAVAVVVLSFFLTNIEGLTPVLNLCIILLLYTLVLSSTVTRFGKYFLKQEIKQEK